MSKFVIERKYIATRGGNVIQVFYNPENDLLVIDLVNDDGGNELIRRTLDERVLLGHLRKG